MNIELNDRYRIVTDNHNYILQEKKVADSNNPLTKKVGNIRYIDLGYYGRLEHLVRGLLEKEIKTEITTNLIALNVKLTELEKSIVYSLEKTIKGS